MRLQKPLADLYRAEVIHKDSPWTELEEVEHTTLEWVDWFNPCRFLEPIGDISPVGVVKLYYDLESVEEA